MFNQNEAQSAASAITNAYRLVSCASSSQPSPDNSDSYILECEAILLRFRCHYRDGQLSISGSPQSLEVSLGCASGAASGGASVGASALAIVPTPAMRSLPPAIKQTMSQSEEEILIGQIEAALLSTIADMEKESKIKTTPQEKTITDDLPSYPDSSIDLDSPIYSDSSIEAPSIASVATAAVTVPMRKLRSLQSPPSMTAHRELPTAKTRFTNIYVHVWLKLIESMFSKNEIKLTPHLDRLARLSYEAGLTEVAFEIHSRSLSLKHNCLGRKHVGRAANLESIARIHYERGDFAAAESAYLEAIMLREIFLRRHFGKSSQQSQADENAYQEELLNLAEAVSSLAQIYAEKGRIWDSEQQFKRALRLLQSPSLPASGLVAEVTDRLLFNYRTMLSKACCVSGSEAMNTCSEIVNNRFRASA